jgi:predicted permease
MTPLRSLRLWLSRLAGLFNKPRRDRELAAEIESNVALHIEDNLRAGMTPAEARRQALLKFGGVESAKERYRDRRGIPFLETTWQDIRFALRMLRKSPGFTTVAVLTLALGIGANTAVFSLLDAVLIRSLPYNNPDRLVYLWTPNRKLPQFPLEISGPSVGDFFEIQRQMRSFSSITLFSQQYFNLVAEGPAQRVSGVFVQPDFFSTFGVNPLFGRGFEGTDTEPGSGGVAVISYALWQSAFGGSANVLGKSMILNGQHYHVVGVMPGWFGYPSGNELPYSNSGKTQVWLPMVLTAQQKIDRENSSGLWVAVARLRPRITIAQAQAEFSSIVPRLVALQAANSLSKGMYGVVKPFTETVVGGVRLFLWLLFGAVSLVLLVACANAANLLLARAAARTHEMGVRAALGAGRGRLIRQVLTEAVLLACAGGAFGIFIAYAAIRAFLRLNPGNIPRLTETSIDSGVLLFVLVVSLLTGVIFGILPALGVSRANLSELLKQAGHRGISASTRWRYALIVGEVALAVVLLTGSGLLIRSYMNLQSVSTGFSDSTLSMHIALDNRYSRPARRQEFFRSVLDRIGALPGVEAAGAVSALPLSHNEQMQIFSVEGYANKPYQMVDSRLASESYFQAMDIPLLAGRFFTSQDGANGAPGVVIVNQAFVNDYLHGRSTIGAHLCVCPFTAGRPVWSTLVGVVGNTRFSNLEAAPPPEIYRPFWQNGQASGGAYFAIRTSSPGARIIPAIRDAVRSIDPTIAVADIQTMDQRVSNAGALRLFQTSLFGIFAAVALFLAAIGLYALMAFSVRQRTNEIGIRIALGAQPANVLKLILAQGLLLTILGISIGVAGALALTRFLSSLVYGIAPTDPATFIGVSLVLIAAALLACWVPARRAMRVDPVTALRCE